MAMPSRDKTFALENCRDMLRKLEWEIEQLQGAAIGADWPPDQAFRVWNAAVTAWHISDWVWEDIKEQANRAQAPHRVEAVMKLGEPLSDGESEAKAIFTLHNRHMPTFQEWCSSQCRELHLCYQIATSCKHAVMLNDRRDPDVGTLCTVQSTLSEDPSSGIRLPPQWGVFFLDNNVRKPALDVFQAACEFWNQFIYANRLGY